MKRRWRSLISRTGVTPGTPLRLRLTLVYGLLSIASGAFLLLLTYLLLARNQRGDVQAVRVKQPLFPPSARPTDLDLPFPPVRVVQESQADVYNMLLLAGLALAIVALLSV